jgi:hypothetical protein
MTGGDVPRKSREWRVSLLKNDFVMRLIPHVWRAGISTDGSMCDDQNGLKVERN